MLLLLNFFKKINKQKERKNFNIIKNILIFINKRINFLFDIFDIESLILLNIFIIYNDTLALISTFNEVKSFRCLSTSFCYIYHVIYLSTPIYCNYNFINLFNYKFGLLCLDSIWINKFSSISDKKESVIHKFCE